MYENPSDGASAVPAGPPPAFLMRGQPAARFALCDDGRLMVTVGDVTVVLTPEDIRRLDRFMGNVAAAQEAAK